MSLNLTERRIIERCAARLDAEAAAERGVSPEVVEALRKARHYLDTWVIAPLRLVAAEDRMRHDLALADDLTR
jgi:hypothetical protein